MFADGVRLNDLRVLAAHRIEEGMQACIDLIRTQNPCSSERRTPEILDILVTYGVSAQEFTSNLNKLDHQFEKGEVDFPKRLSQEKAKAVRDAIRRIKSSQDRPKMKRIR